MSDSSKTLEIQRLIDAIADEFEAARHTGQAARLEHYLAEAPEGCEPVLFRELLAVELQLRRDEGDEPRYEEYEARFPHHGDDIRAAFQMADDTGDSFSTMPDLGYFSQETAGNPQSCPGCRTDVEVPARYGRFELLEKLGSGGFGTVWKARDTVLKRLVALKIPQTGQLCPRDASLLMHEARSAARLKHAGVAQVYDAGTVDGTTYIASEYIAGVSLREHLKDQCVSCRRAAEICLRVAEALHHAHQMGIVHRDLKPGNILLDELGTAYVTDFGLAKTEDLETQAGQLVGTVSYMAPEQAAGRIGEVDHRADVYSLGVILYEMLTGQRPFQSDRETLLEVIQTVEPVRPRKRNRSIPLDLEAVCLRCLNKNPDDRYGSAEELAEDLRKFLQDEPVRARPLSAPWRVGRWARRRPAVAALTLTSLLLLVAVVAVGAVSYLQTARALDTAEIHLYSHRVTAADRAWQANDIAQFDRLLEECPPRLRGWEWGYLNGLRRSADLVLQDAGGPVAFSPDGKLIATGGGDDWVVKLWDATTGQKLGKLASHQSHVCSVDFSRDGRLLVSAGGSDTMAILWDVAARQKIGVFRGHTGPVHSAQFLPDGNRLVTASADGSLRVWNTESQEELFRFDHGELHLRSLAVCPDGRLVALSTGSGKKAKIRVWDVESREMVWDVPAFDRAAGLAFSSDGTQLAAAAGRELTRIWDVASREMVQAYPVTPIAAPDVAFSSDGRWFALTCWDNSVALCDTKVGQPILAFRGHEGQVQEIAFSRDGQSVAFGTSANCVYVHCTSSDQGMMTFAGHEGRVGGLAFVPGSQQLVSGGYDGTVRLWDLAQRRELRLLLQQDSPLHGIATSPGGTTIASVTEDGVIRTWNAESGEALCEFRGEEGFAHDLAYAPSEAVLASVSGGSGVTLWNTMTGQVRHSFDAECSPIHKIVFSPCGRWLAIGTRDRQVRVFDVQTWSSKWEFILDSPVAGLAFSKGGVVAAVAADASVDFWNVATGKTLWELPPTGVRRQASLAFHPNGTRFAMAIGGDSVTFWEFPHRQRFLALRKKADVAGLVSFSSDGRYVASATEEGAICVWSSSANSADE